MILLAEDPGVLLGWRDAIAAFLERRLLLQLRPEPATPEPVRNGVDFVGWRTW